MAHYPGHKGGFSSGRSGAAQRSFKRSVSKARSRGIDTRSLAQKNEALENQQKKNREQAQGSDDNRSAYLIKQATQPIIDRNKFLMDQEQRRANILSGKITPKKSDFTGYEGGLFGLRVGDYEDRNEPGFAKIREGLTSAQYADYMKDLYNANPAMMDKYFPAGKFVAQMFTPAPFKFLATGAKEKGIDAIQGLKQIAIDKGILPNDKLNTTTGTTAVSGPAYDSSGLEGYRDAIMRMNQTMSPLSQNFYGGRSPVDELFAMNPTTQFGREYNRRVGPRADLNTAPQQMSSSEFLMDQARKNFEAPVLGDEQMLAELNAGQRAVLDQRANRFAFDQGLATPQDMLNKIRPLDKSGILGFGGNEANLQDVVDFYNNNPTVTMAEGGLASINNPEYTMLRRASDFDI